MEKKYVTFDVEASGPTPGRYSMLSLGACVVGNTGVQFYRELKPLNMNYVLEAIRIGCLGLQCLEDLKHLPEYNPKNPNFDPLAVLGALEKTGSKPEDAMADYAKWVLENTQGFRPVEVAAPIKFDGMFSTWYFDNFYNKENPLGYSGEDMSSMYRGATGNVNAGINEIKIPERGQNHNALQDAVYQAKKFERILELMKGK